MKPKLKILFALAICLTLGLAPFTPEPHIWGKLKWIVGGTNGMTFMDYWDTLLHGLPWILLIYFIVQYFIAPQQK